jgi:putative component of membrane protein insertase Oxa1/YidC/SpoIIIJ protein YidD
LSSILFTLECRYEPTCSAVTSPEKELTASYATAGAATGGGMQSDLPSYLGLFSMVF